MSLLVPITWIAVRAFPPFQSFGNLKIIQLDLMSNEAVRFMNPLLLIPLLIVMALSAFYRVSHNGVQHDIEGSER